MTYTCIGWVAESSALVATANTTAVVGEPLHVSTIPAAVLVHDIHYIHKSCAVLPLLTAANVAAATAQDE